VLAVASERTQRSPAHLLQIVALERLLTDASLQVGLSVEGGREALVVESVGRRVGAVVPRHPGDAVFGLVGRQLASELVGSNVRLKKIKAHRLSMYDTQKNWPRARLLLKFARRTYTVSHFCGSNGARTFHLMSIQSSFCVGRTASVVLVTGPQPGFKVSRGQNRLLADFVCIVCLKQIFVGTTKFRGGWGQKKFTGGKEKCGENCPECPPPLATGLLGGPGICFPIPPGWMTSLNSIVFCWTRTRVRSNGRGAIYSFRDIFQKFPTQPFWWRKRTRHLESLSRNYHISISTKRLNTIRTTASGTTLHIINQTECATQHITNSREQTWIISEFDERQFHSRTTQTHRQYFARTSPVATGGFGGLTPPNKTSSPPNWNNKHYKSGVFVKF